MASSQEMAWLPVVSEKVHADALAALSCPNLGDHGCQVYAERPLVCRLFGTTPKLACPRGKHPAEMIEPHIEEQIYDYFNAVRHVLV